MFSRLERLIFNTPGIASRDPHKTELFVEFINGSQIHFKSGEVFNRLRGPALNGCVIDEVRDQHPDLFPMIIRPMLTTTKGFCLFISTPSGFDAFYDFAQRATTDPDEWAFIRAPSTASPYFPREEYEAAQRDMSEAQFDQEINANFRDLTAGKAYISFSEANLMNECPWQKGSLFSPYHSIVVGMDFNISPMAWNIGQYRDQEWWWFDEIWLKNSHTQEASHELARRVLLYRNQGYRGTPELILCGDATSKASQRAAAGQSDYDIVKNILDSYGITWEDRTPESNPGVKDRVNTVNGRCKDATGQQHMWVHPVNCPHLKRDMDRVVWKPGGQAILDQTTDTELTHSSDGIGYSICELTPLKLSRKTVGIAVISRAF